LASHSQCAKWILPIPATSTSSERTFLLAGRTLDDRRTQLNPETVDGLLFLHGLKWIRGLPGLSMKNILS